MRIPILKGVINAVVKINSKLICQGVNLSINGSCYHIRNLKFTIKECNDSFLNFINKIKNSLKSFFVKRHSSIKRKKNN